MKKIIPLFCMLFAFTCVSHASVGDTLNFYVDVVNGSESGDGLSEATAGNSFSAIVDSALLDTVATTYIINVAAGEIMTDLTVILFDRDSADITFKIIGAGADATQFTGASDSLYEAYYNTGGKNIAKFINVPRSMGGKLTLEFENCKFRNYGFTNTNNGGLILLNSSQNVDLNMTNCVVERCVSRMGSVIYATGGSGKVSLKNCFFSEIRSFHYNGVGAPIYVTNALSLEVENCVFSNSAKSEKGTTKAIDYSASTGNVISFLPNTAEASFSLVNNTFIGDSIFRTDMTLPQSAVCVRSSAADVPVTIANNLFVGAYNASSIDYYDVHLDAASSALALTNCTHNVMCSQLGLDAASNRIDPTYTYDAEAIDFTMDGDYPAMFTTATGVQYVKANGSDVFQTGLASVAPAADITGAERAETPCVGAYEASEDIPTAQEELQEGLSIYPNPVQDMLHIEGNTAYICIYDMAGVQVLAELNTTAGVDLSALNKGIYFIKCQDASGRTIATQKIIKE